MNPFEIAYLLVNDHFRMRLRKLSRISVACRGLIDIALVTGQRVPRRESGIGQAVRMSQDSCVGLSVVLIPCTELSLCLPSSPVSDPVSCPIHYTWDVATHRCTQDQRSTVCGDTEFWYE